MPQTTPRFSLSLLAAGQAQKEIIHNEALTRIDALLIPIVESVAPGTVPGTPALGQCWIVGAAPTGLWQGQADALACWTEGGWRFVSPVDAMSVWSRADGLYVHHHSGAWVKGRVDALSYRVQGTQVIGPQRPAIANPTSGSVIDVEARVGLLAVLSALRSHGLIAP
jgi:hypothetical protein